MTTATVWTRDYLRKKGIANQDIGWNPQTGSVSVYGRELKPDSVSPDGKSYASPAALDAFAQTANDPAMALRQRIQALDSWKYDPSQDPAYQQTRKDITRNTMEAMNSKGMLLYSGTPERIAQAAAQAAPQFESAAYGRQQQQIQNATALLDHYTQQQNADRGFALDEAGVTGRYVPAGAQQIAGQIVGLKKQADQAAGQGAPVTSYSSAADALRARLAALGIDAEGLFGKGVTTAQAIANAGSLGVETETARAKRVAEAAAAAKTASSGGGRNGSGSNLSSSAQKAQEQLELSRLVAQDKSPDWETYTPEKKRSEALIYADENLVSGKISVTTYYKLLDEIDRRWPLPKEGTSAPASVGG